MHDRNNPEECHAYINVGELPGPDTRPTWVKLPEFTMSGKDYHDTSTDRTSDDGSPFPLNNAKQLGLSLEGIYRDLKDEKPKETRKKLANHMTGIFLKIIKELLIHAQLPTHQEHRRI